MKLFISQPMKNKTADYIQAVRKGAKLFVENAVGPVNGKVEVLDTVFKDFEGNRLEFLAKSIEALAKADVAVFCDDWEKHDGCRCEHFIAAQYSIPCFYYDVAFIMPYQGGTND